MLVTPKKLTMYNMSTPNNYIQQRGKAKIKCKLFNHLCISNIFYLSSYFTHTHRTYPVYAVSDYTGGGQQYYTATGNYTNSPTGAGAGASSGSYIVPVDEALLTAQARESPHNNSSVYMLVYILLNLYNILPFCYLHRTFHTYRKAHRQHQTI